MRNVNTIEFGHRKAVINSYSDHPALVDSMNKQRESWTAQYPNATVKTERMSYDETCALVAAGGDTHLRSPAHEIGQSSI